MSEIAKWLGVWKENTKPRLLLEAEQRLIDTIRPEIEEAESGESTTMPFNDIFGMPTPDNPRTRMVMPFGNPDIDKLKHILVNIQDKVGTAYLKDPNVKNTNWIGWGVIKQTAMQDVRPLGWVQGDPLEKVEKEIGNLALKIVYKSKMGEQKEITKQLPISTLLKKYMPQYFDWWQGVKGTTGKYVFFTQNPILLHNIIDDIHRNGGRYMKPPEEVKNKIIIASRHPIDTLRMSDFKKTRITSCHSPDATHFKHCMYEIKDNAGGGVLFMMDADKFEATFPDGQIPQRGDVFNDDDRGVDQRLPDPTARLRLRKVIDDNTGTEYAVPDKRIYPSFGDPSFIDSSFQFFAEKQKDKFEQGGKIDFPEPRDLVRFGGSYEDGGDESVGDNFVKLMDTVIDITGKRQKIESDSYLKGIYTQLKTSLERSSIKWGGDYAEENRYNNRCDQLEEAANEYNGRDLDYFGFYVNTECENNPPYAYIGATANFYYKYEELQDWFRAEVAADKGLWSNGSDIERALRRNDYLMDLCGVSLTYPDLDFGEIDVRKSDDHRGPLEITLSYNGVVSDPDGVESTFNDLSRFEDKATYAIMREAIRLAMVELDMAIEAPYNLRGEEINNFADWVEEHEGFKVNEEKNKMEFKYSKLLAEEFVLRLENEKLRTDVLASNLRLAISEEFNYEFLNMFRRRAEKYKKEIARQLPLFSGMDTRPPETLAYKNFTDAFPEPQTKPSLDIVLDYKGGFPATPEKQTVKFIFKFETQLNTSLTDEEINAQMRYIKEIVDDEEVMLEIAYNALQKVIAPGYSSLAEQKKKSFTREEAKQLRKLLKEWYTRKGNK